MSIRKVTRSCDSNFSESLFPKPLQNFPILKDKISTRKLNSRFKDYLNSSPFANNSKIKEILGLNNSNYSELSSSKHLKLNTNFIPEKRTKLSTWVLPYRKYSILPKIKLKSSEKLDKSLNMQIPKSIEKPMTDKCTSINHSIAKSDRKIILSKLSENSHGLIKSSLEFSPDYYRNYL